MGRSLVDMNYDAFLRSYFEIFLALKYHWLTRVVKIDFLGPRFVVQIGEKIIDYNEDFRQVNSLFYLNDIIIFLREDVN